MELIPAVGLAAAIATVVIAYLQWSFPRAPKNPEAPNAPNGTLKRVLERKELRIGFFHYPPLMNCNDSANGVVATGLYAEVLQKFADQNSLRIDWHAINLSQAISAVQRGDVDC